MSTLGLSNGPPDGQPHHPPNRNSEPPANCDSSPSFFAAWDSALDSEKCFKSQRHEARWNPRFSIGTRIENTTPGRHPIQTLKLATYSAYLTSWLIVTIAAVAGALPRFLKPSEDPKPTTISAPTIIGTILQILAAFTITNSLPKGNLQPTNSELLATLFLSPLSAALFVWALRSVPKNADPDQLITTGAYRWLRHPIYLAFLLLLLASGLLISAGTNLILSTALYLFGSELRIALEESELTARFPTAYPQYCKQTRWRYLPGLR